MFPVIGVGGKARSGKNYVAALIRDVFGFLPWAFAHPIKFNVYSKQDCSWDLDTLFYKDKPEELRNTLQQLGTEMGRDVYGPHVWTRQAEAFIFLAEHDFKAKGVVMTDVRFPNEAECIHNLGGIVLNVERREAGLEGVLGEHRSETLLDQVNFDGVIANNGSCGNEYLLEQLRPYVLKLGVD